MAHLYVPNRTLKHGLTKYWPTNPWDLSVLARDRRNRKKKGGGMKNAICELEFERVVRCWYWCAAPYKIRYTTCTSTHYSEITYARPPGFCSTSANNITE